MICIMVLCIFFWVVNWVLWIRECVIMRNNWIGGFKLQNPLCIFVLWRRVLVLYWSSMAKPLSFWWFKCDYTMFIGYAYGYELLVLFMLGVGHGLAVFRMWSEENLCNFRPSRFISPKRELQSLVFGFGSRFSPKRPGIGLSDLVSRQARDTRPGEVARKPRLF